MVYSAQLMIFYVKKSGGVLGDVTVSVSPNSVPVCFVQHDSDPPGREEDPENKTSSDLCR